MTERLHFLLSCIGEGNGNPLQCCCLENPRDRAAWWAAIYGVAQSRTQLKGLSSSSSSLSYTLVWLSSLGLHWNVLIGDVESTDHLEFCFTCGKLLPVVTVTKPSVCLIIYCKFKHLLYIALGIFPAAAAKSLQLCPTLYNPRDGSPPGSPVPGILQARTLEWVAISFSSAWKWKVKVKSLSRVGLPATPWTAAHQAPQSMGFSRQEYWSGLPLPSPVYPRNPRIQSLLLPYSSHVGCYDPQVIKQGQFI